MKRKTGVRPSFLLATIACCALLAAMAWLVLGKGYGEGFADKTTPDGYVWSDGFNGYLATIEGAPVGCILRRIDGVFYRDMPARRLPALRDALLESTYEAAAIEVAETETLRSQDIDLLISHIVVTRDGRPANAHVLNFGYGGEGHMLLCAADAPAASRRAMTDWIAKIKLTPR